MKTRYLPHDAWNKPRRLAWLGGLVGAALMVPLCIGKAITQLVALKPHQAIKTLIVGPVLALGVAVLSVTSLVAPSLGRYVIRKNLLHAKYNSEADYGPKGQAKKMYSVDYRDHHVDVKLLKTPRGSVEQVVIRPNQSSDAYTIRFCGNASFHQAIIPLLIGHRWVNGFFPGAQGDVAQSRNIFCVNYPGTNPNQRENYQPKSANDLVNAGIAQVYQVIHELQQKKNLNLDELRQNLKNHLNIYGHSLGGGVALQVAMHFKKFHQIDLPVFVDRSFSSLKDVVAKYAEKLCSLPVWFGKKFASCMLYAGGGWNLDSVKASRELNPQMVHGINLARPALDKPKSFFQGWSELILGPSMSSSRPLSWTKKIKNFFFNTQDPDPVIPEGATFAQGMQKAAVKQMISRMSIDSNLSHESKSDSTQRVLAKLPKVNCREICYRDSMVDPHSDHLSTIESKSDVDKNDFINGQVFYEKSFSKRFGS